MKVPVAEGDRVVLNVYDPKTRKYAPRLLPVKIAPSKLAKILEAAGIEPPEETP